MKNIGLGFALLGAFGCYSGQDKNGGSNSNTEEIACGTKHYALMEYEKLYEEVYGSYLRDFGYITLYPEVFLLLDVSGFSKNDVHVLYTDIAAYYAARALYRPQGDHSRLLIDLGKQEFETFIRKTPDKEIWCPYADISGRLEILERELGRECSAEEKFPVPLFDSVCNSYR